METLLERFIRYAKINTRSSEESNTIPSTQSQVDFAKMLVEELKELNFSEVEYNDQNGYVTATIPSNIDKEVDVIGFIAHYDTADFNADNIAPRIIEDYDGQDIVLNQDLIMSVQSFPRLLALKGHTLVVTDGTTLLGADDKAGLVEIIEAMITLIQNKELKHGEVRIAFGPDEEIGQGADHFDAPSFRANYAYTMDGAAYGELEYESFNAAVAKIDLKGVSVHPGSAKDTLINTANLAFEFNALLPQNEVPEHTDHYEGYYFLMDMKTAIDSGSMTYIIRDHDKQKFIERKQTLLDNAAFLNKKYKAERFKIEMHDQYYNMAEIIEKDMKPINVALKAMENLGIKSHIKPIRGGTDGSKISFMGIPTPNIFTGGDNYHGPYEYVSVDVMKDAVKVILEIIKINAEQ